MADAEDLKSSGDFSSCGFDSHPGTIFLQQSQLMRPPVDSALPWCPRGPVLAEIMAVLRFPFAFLLVHDASPERTRQGRAARDRRAMNPPLMEQRREHLVEFGIGKGGQLHIAEEA